MPAKWFMKFQKIIRGGLSVVLMSVMLAASVTSGDAQPSGLTVETAMRQKIEAIERRYGLRMTYRKVPAVREIGMLFEEIRGKDYPYVLRFLLWLDEELAKYPEGFFPHPFLREIRLVDRFFQSEHPAGGVYVYQPRVMYLEFLRWKDNESRQRRTIHHEMFHMMEYQAALAGFQFSDWEALNASSFHYGKKDALEKIYDTMDYSRPPMEGFVSAYGSFNAKEDRAEIFASLMLPRQQKLVEQWAQRDARLNAKVEAIKNFMQRYHPQMGPDYWTWLGDNNSEE